MCGVLVYFTTPWCSVVFATCFFAKFRQKEDGRDLVPGCTPHDIVEEIDHPLESDYMWCALSQNVRAKSASLQCLRTLTRCDEAKIPKLCIIKHLFNLIRAKIQAWGRKRLFEEAF